MQPQETSLFGIILAMLDLRQIPADLKAVYLWLVIAPVCIFLPPLSDTAIRVLVSLPLVLLIPGYALLAALFPRRSDLGLGERFALSIGMSIAMVPLAGLVLNYTPWGIRLVPVMVSLVLVSAVLSVLAQGRRLALPPADRFGIGTADLTAPVNAALFPEGASRLDRALSLVLLFSVVLALGTTLFVIATPRIGERFTEFYILDLNGKAADYPTSLQPGEPAGVIVGIGNQEYRPVQYTVELHLANWTWDTVTNTSRLERMVLLDSFSVAVAHNETYERPVNFTVEDPAFNRLDFLLFNETVAPPSVTGTGRIDASYRNLHLWIRVAS